MTHLTLKHVGVRLHQRSLLTDISLEWPTAKVGGIIGPNGAGKSTLLKAINHMVPITGQIEYQQQPLNIRVTRLAYVPQLNRSDSALTVFEMVLLGQVRQLRWRVTTAQTAAVEQVLAECGISSLARQAFATLSGGQRQLVMLAQAFVAQPQIILLDEPTSALDIYHQLHVLQKIVDYSERHQCTTLMVIHDLSLALRFCQTLTLIHRGHIACHGAAHQVIAHPMMSTVFGVGIENGTSPQGYRYLLPTQCLPVHGDKICMR